MKKPDVSGMYKIVKTAATKHSPKILMGIGIAGMVTTTVLAVRATPKALRLIEEADENKKELDGGALSKVEIVKAAWKPYVPAAMTGVVSISCLIGSCSVSARRSAALATAYKISETALAEYREKVTETIGEKKEKAIREEIAKERIEKTPMSEIIITEKGNTLFYDFLSGRYFKSDRDKIDKAVNQLNKQMLSEMYISLTDFYYEIGLKPTKISDDLGWNTNDGLIDIIYSAQIAEDGNPCIAMDYLVAPRYDYAALM